MKKTLTKEDIDGAFGPLPTYNINEVMLRLIDLAIDRFDYVEKVDGLGRCGNELWDYLFSKFHLYDSIMYPGSCAGWAWNMGPGWGKSDELEAWEVEYKDEDVRYSGEKQTDIPPVVEPDKPGGEFENEIIRDFDLSEYGFIRLTGEACGLGMRTLYDLTQEGVDAFCDFFGLGTIELGGNWNHSDGQVASCMLTHDMLRNLSIYLLARKWPVVLDVQFNGHGYSASFVAGMTREELIYKWGNRLDWLYPGGWKIWKAGGTAAGGTRNRHMMSGRVS